eukprot:gb/GECG01006920.1/.p1 GENE.gb/GECG01006920.1/~~gb/GECG01006920.1/.p1  ORF type:complete len:398 (+),score=54.43 gb/GECG01006920.1/:1-1194(+)
MSSSRENEHFHERTQCIVAGESPHYWENLAEPPISLGVTYCYDDPNELEEVALNKRKGHVYSRNTNPVTRIVENKLAQLEHGEECVAFSTGMAAISNSLHTFLEPGDRVVSIRHTYGGTSQLFLNFFPKYNVECVLCETEDYEQLEAEARKGCKILYIESPTNPTLRVVDIARMAKVAKEVGAYLFVDNTFATPINQNPIVLGADIVLHSATKYLNGHGDALAGFVVGRKDLVDQIYHYREITGATISPFNAYMVLRGIKTLSLRVKQHNKNAMEIAKYLKKHPKVTEVFYPGLEDHKHHDIAKKQSKDGYGGMLSFTLKGDNVDDVKAFLRKMKVARVAASLGHVDSLVGPPALTSHVECTKEERANLGISEGLVRYSTGIEDHTDLIADLEAALQ